MAATAETPAAPGAATNLPAIPPPDDKAVQEIARQIDLGDRARLSGFGEHAQRQVVDFADRILGQARNRDLGDTGGLLQDIILKAERLDPASLKERGFLGRLFGSLESRIKRFVMQFEDVATQIESIAIDLDQHRDRLRHDIAVLDQLHAETLQSVAQLDTYIAAGKHYVDRFRAERLPGMEQAAAAATGPQAVLEAQALRDIGQALERLEKRVFYLQQARQVGLQQLPQIRIVQSGDETLIENLSATINLTVPLWKQKMVLVLGLTHQQQALEMQRTVTDATNQMLRQTAEMMKGQAIEVEKQAQRGIVDIETLEHTNAAMVGAIRGVLTVQREGRARRADAEQRMEAMNGQLRTALIEAAR
ncbi:MAG TPA: toxic anion resistance protein [Roseomonas sp.]